MKELDPIIEKFVDNMIQAFRSAPTEDLIEAMRLSKHRAKELRVGRAIQKDEQPGSSTRLVDKAVILAARSGKSTAPVPGTPTIRQSKDGRFVVRFPDGSTAVRGRKRDAIHLVHKRGYAFE